MSGWDISGCTFTDLRGMGVEDYQRLRRIVAAIKCHPVRLAVSPMNADRVLLHINMDVPDINDSGETIQLGFSPPATVDRSVSAKELVRRAVEAAQHLMVHEFLEWIEVGGDRVFDPHLDDDESEKRLHAAAFRVAVSA